ncbi:MAG: CHAT domain-containing protein [Oscillatoriales cyanobacterium C42_A2020_001]|nr:CHAT domain-containing protein [Leptolyngbyaceae cyanobacterium C42_A2020_001]
MRCSEFLGAVFITISLLTTGQLYSLGAEFDYGTINTFKKRFFQDEAEKLFEEASKQFSERNFSAAIITFDRVLSIQYQLNDRVGVGETLNEIGRCYFYLQQFSKASEFYQKALVEFRSIRNNDQKRQGKEGEGKVLINLGVLRLSKGRYIEAFDFFQTALVIFQKLESKPDLRKTLNNLGVVALRLGRYAEAIDYLKRAFEISQEIDDIEGQGSALTNLGDVYQALGQYSQALKSYQQAEPLFDKTRNSPGQAKLFNNIGLAYSRQHQYSQAVQYYKQTLSIHQLNQDRFEEGRTLNNLGWTYIKDQKPDQALPPLLEALKINQELSDRQFEGDTLDSLGYAYNALGKTDDAIATYQQALVIRREIGDIEGKGVTLNHLGQLFEQQNQTELAIAFYKQSVNVREGIRKGIRSLSRDLQQSYTDTVAETYRRLADLLLTQGRILEAQQVLELLKVQEIQDYTRDTRAVVTKDGGIQYTPVEQKIVNQFGGLIAFGQKVADCERTKCGQLSQLNQEREALTAQYNQEIQQIQKEIRDRKASDKAFFDPESLGTSAQEIVEAQPNTVLIYPLVLNEKLWLLWVAPNGIVNRVEVPVGKTELGQTVLKFRQLLGDEKSDVAEVRATGKQLYQWLIQPLEKELKRDKVQTLIFSLDRVTRYIPMAALFDGERYLIERYQVSTILSAELTDKRDRLPQDPQSTQVLALGLSEAKAGYKALNGVPVELDNVVRTDAKDTTGVYPGTVFLNQTFTFRSLADNLLGRTIIHIATHGKFVPGSLDASYLLTGTGEQLTIPQINTLPNLGKVHLVVLSACETALGGPDAEGLEIAGLAYYFTARGRAKAVLATLWQVNDASTSQLMQQFYQNLATGKMTKTEALRQAQMVMITGKTQTSTTANSRSSVQFTPGRNQTAAISSDRRHPYYWAPFILIGNGL